NVLKELNNWDSDQFLRSFVPLVIKETDKLNQKSPDGYMRFFLIFFHIIYKLIFYLIRDFITSSTTYTTSPVNRFVLLTWVNLLITFALSRKSPNDSPYWKNLVDAQAILLHSL